MEEGARRRAAHACRVALCDVVAACPCAPNAFRRFVEAKVDDQIALSRAIIVGEQGRRTSAPNPWVGCVITQHDHIVGEGFHRTAGMPHAEPQALAAAGSFARGGTAYVTLEPCNHHGRTPPCTDALITAGITRVVIAQLDPDPRVSGRGVERLRAAGITVTVGICADEAAWSLAPYFHHRRTGRAFCLAKTAVSIDGRTGAADGTSQWITGQQARANAHELRAESQAIIVGPATASNDRPSLTARDVHPPVERQPLRVLIDARGRVRAEGPLFDQTIARTLVMTTTAVNPDVINSWRHAGAEVLAVTADADGRVDLAAALTVLGGRGVLQAMVEGGSSLHGAFLKANLINHLVVYVGPRTIGAQGHSMFGGDGPGTLADAGRWNLVGVQRFDNDLRLDYTPIQSEVA